MSKTKLETFKLFSKYMICTFVPAIIILIVLSIDTRLSAPMFMVFVAIVLLYECFLSAKRTINDKSEDKINWLN